MIFKVLFRVMLVKLRVICLVIVGWIVVLYLVFCIKLVKKVLVLIFLVWIWKCCKVFGLLVVRVFILGIKLVFIEGGNWLIWWLFVLLIVWFRVCLVLIGLWCFIEYFIKEVIIEVSMILCIRFCYFIVLYWV